MSFRCPPLHDARIACTRNPVMQAIERGDGLVGAMVDLLQDRRAIPEPHPAYRPATLRRQAREIFRTGAELWRAGDNRSAPPGATKAGCAGSGTGSTTSTSSMPKCEAARRQRAENSMALRNPISAPGSGSRTANSSIRSLTGTAVVELNEPQREAGVFPRSRSGFRDVWLLDFPARSSRASNRRRQ